jgi:hypothetical protein
VVPWRCERFNTSPQYSGPGPGDPKFFETSTDPIIVNGCDYGNVHSVRFEGDSAERTDGAVAGGVELDRSVLVRLKLLPPDVVDGDDTNAKAWAPRVAQDLKRAGKLDEITKKTEYARLIKDAGPPGSKAGVAYIRDNVENWDIWPISKIKI